MYLRHSTVRKDGKTHTSWRVVRSVRRNGKVAQETVAHLGELDAEGRLRARSLARHITGRGDPFDLFEDGARTLFYEGKPSHDEPFGKHPVGETLDVFEFIARVLARTTHRQRPRP